MIHSERNCTFREHCGSCWVSVPCTSFFFKHKLFHIYLTLSFTFFVYSSMYTLFNNRHCRYYCWKSMNRCYWTFTKQNCPQITIIVSHNNNNNTGSSSRSSSSSQGWCPQHSAMAQVAPLKFLGDWFLRRFL